VAALLAKVDYSVLVGVVVAVGVQLEVEGLAVARKVVAGMVAARSASTTVTEEVGLRVVVVEAAAGAWVVAGAREVA